MGRILAIDYGRRRCGVAVTDILKISANGLPTVATGELMNFLKEYCANEQVEEIVIGEPKDLHGNESDSMRYIRPFLGNLRKQMPEMKITMFDERFTSTIAHREMLAGGFSKKQRAEKGRADEMAAVLILTGYLDSRRSVV